MPGLGQGPATPAGASPDVAAEIYQRLAGPVYGQALLILGDEILAERVTRDVIVNEVARPPRPAESAAAASRRLAVSVLRRCQELAPDQVRVPGRRRPGGGVRSRSHRVRRSMEREALALVLFGGFGYRQVGQVLAIPAAEAAALLRTAMLSRAGLAGRVSRARLTRAGDGGTNHRPFGTMSVWPHTSHYCAVLTSEAGTRCRWRTCARS